jgi:hypothetical protein
MISVKRVLLAGLAAAVFASAASATNIYVATNITGAQTQIDIDHRSYWTFSTRGATPRLAPSISR